MDQLLQLLGAPLGELAQLLDPVQSVLDGVCRRCVHLTDSNWETAACLLSQFMRMSMTCGRVEDAQSMLVVGVQHVENTAAAHGSQAPTGVLLRTYMF